MNKELYSIQQNHDNNLERTKEELIYKSRFASEKSKNTQSSDFIKGVKRTYEDIKKIIPDIDKNGYMQEDWLLAKWILKEKNGNAATPTKEAIKELAKKISQIREERKEKKMRKRWANTRYLLFCFFLGAGFLSFAQSNKILHTESDGFQWYMCSNNHSRKWIELTNGAKIAEDVFNDINWEEVRYIPSHKVLYVPCKYPPSPECLREAVGGGLYTAQGTLLSKGSWAPFKYLFREHGIIISSDYERSGVYLNGSVIIPFDMDYKDIAYYYGDDIYVAMKSDYRDKNIYFIYSDKGELIGGEYTEKFSIIFDDYHFSHKTFFYDGTNTYDNHAKKLFQGQCKDYFYHNNICYLLVTNNNLYGIKDINGKEIIPSIYSSIKKNDNPDFLLVELDSKKGICNYSGTYILHPRFEQLYITSDNEYIKVRLSDRKYGLYKLDGTEVLAPEFEDCDLIGDNSIKFKVNGYWGVMSKAGKMIIPTSRLYTMIEYNRTFKKFYFEKEGGYKGECNSNGVQTSINKVQTPEPTATTTNNNPPIKKNTASNSSSSSNKKELDSKPSEPGLLYRGEYTISNPLSFPMPETISIYEDKIDASTYSAIYKSTNTRGERLYVGDGAFGVTHIFYVDANYDIRLIERYPNQWTGESNDVICTVIKGVSGTPTQNNTGTHSNGGYSTPPPSSSNSSSGTSTNPVQPHQRTKICTSCGHSGKCPNCNGKGWRTVNGTSTVRCTNCNGTGRCPYCGGTGEKTVTEYY